MAEISTQQGAAPLPGRSVLVQHAPGDPASGAGSAPCALFHRMLLPGVSGTTAAAAATPPTAVSTRPGTPPGPTHHCPTWSPSSTAQSSRPGFCPLAPVGPPRRRAAPSSIRGGHSQFRPRRPAKAAFRNGESRAALQPGWRSSTTYGNHRKRSPQPRDDPDQTHPSTPQRRHAGPFGRPGELPLGEDLRMGLGLQCPGLTGAVARQRREAVPLHVRTPVVPAAAVACVDPAGGHDLARMPGLLLLTHAPCLRRRPTSRDPRPLGGAQHGRTPVGCDQQGTLLTARPGRRRRTRAVLAVGRQQESLDSQDPVQAEVGGGATVISPRSAPGSGALAGPGRPAGGVCRLPAVRGAVAAFRRRSRPSAGTMRIVAQSAASAGGSHARATSGFRSRALNVRCLGWPGRCRGCRRRPGRGFRPRTAGGRSGRVVSGAVPPGPRRSGSRPVRRP